MIAESQESQAFGERIVCFECGIPHMPDAFVGDSVVCQDCTPKVIKRNEAEITPEDYLLSKFEKQLNALKQTAEPQLVPGVQRARDVLGRSPQEIMAEQVKAILSPLDAAGGIENLTPEQLAALPVDRKLLSRYLKMLQDAQVEADKQLSDAGNPYGNMTPDELRGVMLKGATEHAAADIELRMKLIRAMAQQCDTFFDEVQLVAQDLAREKGAIQV